MKFWLMTLTFDLRPCPTIPSYLKVKVNSHTQNQGHRSNSLAVRVFTDTQVRFYRSTQPLTQDVMKNTYKVINGQKASFESTLYPLRSSLRKWTRNVLHLDPNDITLCVVTVALVHSLVEHTCAYTWWALMHRFLHVWVCESCCAPPRGYRTTLRTTDLHCAPLCTRGAYVRGGRPRHPYILFIIHIHVVFLWLTTDMQIKVHNGILYRHTHW